MTREEYAQLVMRHGFHSVAALRKASAIKKNRAVRIAPHEWDKDMRRGVVATRRSKYFELAMEHVASAQAEIAPRGMRQAPTFNVHRGGSIF